MLSAFQETKLRMFFDLLDYDKNGFVEYEDFESIGENMCMMLQFEVGEVEFSKIMYACNQMWKDLYEYVDQNRDKKASVYEWLLYADERIVNCPKPTYNAYVQHMVDHLFILFDRNKDDFISVKEYLNLFMTFRLEARYSARAFSRLDLNEDGLISRDELFKGTEEFFRSDDVKANGNWLFGPWERYVPRKVIPDQA